MATPCAAQTLTDRGMTVSAGSRRYRGTPVVPGVGYAPAVRPGERPQVAVGSSLVDAAEVPHQAERFRVACESVADRLRGRAARSTGAAAEVLAATAAMAQDRGWCGDVLRRIESGRPAEDAVVEATGQLEQMLAKVGGMMAERVTDLRDVRDRVLCELLGVDEPGVPRPEVPSILLADDLAPADTAGLDPAAIAGLVTSGGGPTSHTAIIARQLGIVCVVAADGVDEISSGTPVLVDGDSGDVIASPHPADALARVDADRRTRERTALWSGPGRTRDGHRIGLLVNVQDGESAELARNTPAEGVGLFRTELAFLDRDHEPSVEEQASVYARVLRAYSGQKVVIRTLDAGSDKPLRFAHHPAEANPALGVRGVRLSRRSPRLLDDQLDAIGAAGRQTGQRPWVMAPMVATVGEAADFAERARGHGLVPGVMIEVPAAALLAERILEHVDFLSIGTNDLTQYTMGADRMSAELADFTDPWQPAVLHLVARTAEAGVAHGKSVGVCGEAAADPLLACVLAGMGVSSLSMASAAVRAVGSRLACVTLDRCRAAASAALDATSPTQARTYAAGAIEG